MACSVHQLSHVLQESLHCYLVADIAVMHEPNSHAAAVAVLRNAATQAQCSAAASAAEQQAAEFKANPASKAEVRAINKFVNTQITQIAASQEQVGGLPHASLQQITTGWHM